MVYIQNLYLNQQGKHENLKFPISPTLLSFQPNFVEQFNNLWQELVEQVADTKFNETELFYEQKELFNERLFYIEPVFEQLHEAFRIWWASLAGAFAVESTADMWLQNIYMELEQLLKEAKKEPAKAFHLSVLYDKATLVKQQEPAFYAAYAIEDFLRFHKYIPTQLLSNIME